MNSIIEQKIANAKACGDRARNQPKTMLSLAQAEFDRHNAADAAEQIIEVYPQVHSILLHAYESYGTWELEIFDLLDKDGNSLENQEKIKKFIGNEVLDHSEPIRAFEIHSGVPVSLRDLMRAEGLTVIDDTEATSVEFSRLIRSRIFAIQFKELPIDPNTSEKFKENRQIEKQWKLLQDFQRILSEAGYKISFGTPRLHYSATDELVCMTFLVNGDPAAGMCVRNLMLGEWMVFEPLTSPPLGEILDDKWFKKRISG
jgi:hypothetical protein